MNSSNKNNHYQLIGPEKIRAVLTDFYIKAFNDPIIGHFFFEKDINDITNKQVQFASSMLGGPEGYTGLPLKKAHEKLQFRRPHFGRRQVLMKEALEAHQVPPNTVAYWLEQEEKIIDLLRSV